MCRQDVSTNNVLYPLQRFIFNFECLLLQLLVPNGTVKVIHSSNVFNLHALQCTCNGAIDPVRLMSAPIC